MNLKEELNLEEQLLNLVMKWNNRAEQLFHERDKLDMPVARGISFGRRNAKEECAFELIELLYQKKSEDEERKDKE